MAAIKDPHKTCGNSGVIVGYDSPDSATVSPGNVPRNRRFGTVGIAGNLGEIGKMKGWEAFIGFVGGPTTGDHGWSGGPLFNETREGLNLVGVMSKGGGNGAAISALSSHKKFITDSLTELKCNDGDAKLPKAKPRTQRGKRIDAETFKDYLKSEEVYFERSFNKAVQEQLENSDDFGFRMMAYDLFKGLGLSSEESIAREKKLLEKPRADAARELATYAAARRFWTEIENKLKELKPGSDLKKVVGFSMLEASDRMVKDNPAGPDSFVNLRVAWAYAATSPANLISFEDKNILKLKPQDAFAWAENLAKKTDFNDLYTVHKKSYTAALRLGQSPADALKLADEATR